jgi:hypothetical protein
MCARFVEKILRRKMLVSLVKSFALMIFVGACAAADPWRAFNGMMPVWISVTKPPLHGIERIGGYPVLVTFHGIEEACAIAACIIGDGNGVIDRLVEFITSGQLPYNSGSAENQNFVVAAVMAAISIARDIEGNDRLATEMEDVHETRGQWWLPQHASDSSHDPVVDCKKHFSGFDVCGLLRGQSGYVRWACNPERVQQDPDQHFKGIQNIGNTCYLGTAIQTSLRLSGLPESIMFCNRHLQIDDEQRRTAVQALALLFGNMLYGEQATINPRLPHELFHQAGIVSAIGTQRDAIIVMSDIMYAIDPTQRNMLYYRYGCCRVEGLYDEAGNKMSLTMEPSSHFTLCSDNSMADMLNGITRTREQSSDSEVEWSKQCVIYSPGTSCTTVRVNRYQDLTTVTKDTIPRSIPFELYQAGDNWSVEPTGTPSKQLTLKIAMIHAGTSRSGHWFTIYRKQSGEWMELNDGSVYGIDAKEAIHKIEGEEGKSVSALGLIYKSVV